MENAALEHAQMAFVAHLPHLIVMELVARLECVRKQMAKVFAAPIILNLAMEHAAKTKLAANHMTLMKDRRPSAAQIAMPDSVTTHKKRVRHAVSSA